MPNDQAPRANGLQDPIGSVRAAEYAKHESDRIFEDESLAVHQRTDRLLAMIMCVQWPGAIFVATTLGSGAHARNHALWAAIGVGGVCALVTLLCAFRWPGRVSTRQTIAVCQMVLSSLLVHLSGDPNAMQFHVFGSLALLAFYLDWRVLLTATLLRFADQAAMTLMLPKHPSVLSFVNDLLCIFFFDIIVYASCLYRLRTLRAAAKREVEQEILLYQAYHDPLTGLGNRLKIKKLLDEMKAGGVSGGVHFGLLVIDLDKFKEVNDSLGHQVGDEVLTEASRRLKEQIRSCDTVIRMGGDEFAIVLDACSDVKLAERIAARIIESMGRPFDCGAHTVSIGASVGICLHEDDPFVNSDIFHHADLALYKAKNNGRNRYAIFDHGMRLAMSHGISLEQRLRLAVKKEKLVLHYQPMVDVNGELLGFEALLRWEDEVHGHVSPAEFIPLAEKTGLILPLGKWALQRACEQAALWCGIGPRPLTMSVNVCSSQLAHPEFAGLVMTALRQTRLPPELLTLELTEHTLILNRGQAFETMAILRKIGVQLAIDDFGTGYSSLSYLRELPVQSLKIDRAFITDITKSPQARMLVEEMVRLAHTLRLRAVAEGVETEEQLQILVRAGCDQIQGFHISKAITANDATSLVLLGVNQTKQLGSEDYYPNVRLLAG